MNKILHLDKQMAFTPSAMEKITGFENRILADDAPKEVVLEEIKDAKYIVSGSQKVEEDHFNQPRTPHL